MNYQTCPDKSLLEKENCFQERNIKKILILNDLYDSIHFNHLNEGFITHFYTVIYLLKNIFKEAVIQINDRSGVRYNMLWEPGSPLFNNTRVDEW